MTREQDVRDLHLLDYLERFGRARAMADLGASSGRIAGMRWRCVTSRDLPRCKCEKPENQAGGMPPRWWDV